MQLLMNSFFKISPGIIFLVITITVVFLFISITKLLHVKNLNRELFECVVCKNHVIDEFSKTRHEYNNMLQTLVCFIEEEDLVGLKEYKGKLLEKTQLLNKNSITQLGKIKDINILRSVHKLYLNTQEMGIVLSVTICNNITNRILYKDEFYNILKQCLIHTYQEGADEAKVINLKISSNDKGLCVRFENAFNIESRKIVSKTLKARKYKKNNNVVCNRFYQNDHFIQEVLISFN